MTTQTPQGSSLRTEVYNPGDNGIFAVSSVLVASANEAVLIDAQFSAADARKLVDLIKGSGKNLTTIYISHGDPDYYFGLDTVSEAFPRANVLASAPVIAHIEATQAGKLKVWGPQLGSNAPKRVVIPSPLDGSSIDLEGSKLEIVGLDGPTPDRSFVWIPSIETVAGGIPVAAGQHLWMADTQTQQSHADWLATLARIEALKPDIETVRFTASYIRDYDTEAAKAKNSAEMIAAMKARYPDLGGLSSLELSAKVSKGEMEWH
jgi:glyoxylase-like metal-dependent hydrolase (beta-lactamase superfamily II)